MASTPALLFLTGAATGLVGSLLGLGGGVLLVPLLTLALGVPIRTAIAASLMSVIASASASATVNLRRGLVNIRLGLVLEVATSVGGLAGGLASSLLSERALYAAFGVVMAVMGAAMALRSGTRNVISDLSVDTGRLGGRLQEGAHTFVYRVKRLPLGLFASLVAGAVSGLLGVGGGTVMVPLLVLWAHYSQRDAHAASLAAIIPISIAGILTFGIAGRVHWLDALALGAVVGARLGAGLLTRIDERLLKIVFGCFLVAVAVTMGVHA